MIPESLRIAYLQARYRFGAGSDAIELHPGQHCVMLQRWMQDGGLRCAAVLTAFNPGSRPDSTAANLAAQRELRAAIGTGGLPFLEGQNLDPQGRWPPEDSLLIGNLALDDAREISRRFRQLAFLWSDDSAVPQLHATSVD